MNLLDRAIKLAAEQDEPVEMNFVRKHALQQVGAPAWAAAGGGGVCRAWGDPSCGGVAAGGRGLVCFGAHGCLIAWVAAGPASPIALPLP